MKIRLLNLWEKLRTNYWFIPTLMALATLAGAFGAITFDEFYQLVLPERFAWLVQQEAEGARAFLSTVAGATITVTGVIFSVTIVALTLASQQFGPRLLNTFMRDRVNQFVFGTFTSTYLYCLLVLRPIQAESGVFTPQLSLIIAFFLAVFSVGVLIFFIHHVARSIQVMNVIANVSADLQKIIIARYPESYSSQQQRWQERIEEERRESRFGKDALVIESNDWGYLQAVDEEGLLELATKKDLVFEVERQPGEFLFKGAVLVRIWPRDRGREEDLAARIRAGFILGSNRTREQDMEFLIYELVEIALRALSPGVNDPFTAMSCIDHLGAALCELTRRSLPSPYRHDEKNNLRIVIRPQTFAGVVNAAFNQIRQNGRDKAAVSIRLLEVIGALIPQTQDESQRQALLHQATMVDHGCQESLPEPRDRDDVHARYLEIFNLLQKHFGMTGEMPS